MPGRYLVKLFTELQSSGHFRVAPGRATQTFFASRAQIFKEQSRGASGADRTRGRFVSPKRLGGQIMPGESASVKPRADRESYRLIPIRQHRFTIFQEI